MQTFPVLFPQVVKIMRNYNLLGALFEECLNLFANVEYRTGHVIFTIFRTCILQFVETADTGRELNEEQSFNGVFLLP